MSEQDIDFDHIIIVFASILLALSSSIFFKDNRLFEGFVIATLAVIIVILDRIRLQIKLLRKCSHFSYLEQVWGDES